MIEDGGDYDDSMFGDEDICVVDDGTGQSADTNKFDQIVGALTDFMVDETFEVLRNDFCRCGAQRCCWMAGRCCIFLHVLQRAPGLTVACIPQQSFLDLLDFRTRSVVSNPAACTFYRIMRHQQEYAAYRSKRSCKSKTRTDDMLLFPPFHPRRKNCVHFEDSEENKLIYTQLFEQYQKLVETAIEAE